MLLYCCALCYPRTWRNPAPLVSNTIKTLVTIISLCGANFIFPTYHVCGEAAQGVYLANLLWMIVIVLLVCMFSQWRNDRYKCDASAALFILLVALCWTCLLAFNIAVFAAGFRQCRNPKPQTNPKGFCHIFGNLQPGNRDVHVDDLVSWMVWAVFCGISIWQNFTWWGWYAWISRRLAAMEKASKMGWC